MGWVGLKKGLTSRWLRLPWVPLLEAGVTSIKSAGRQNEEEDLHISPNISQKHFVTSTRTPAYTLTAHEVVQLNVGKRFDLSLLEELGSIAEEHGLKGG